jgi:uncharacterized protein (DUF39 family)
MAQAKVIQPLSIGNNYGRIKFGHIDPNNTIGGVTIMNGTPAQASAHYMQLHYSGPLRGGTTNRCPGTYQIICGKEPTHGIGLIIDVADGDIVIQARNGDIRMKAKNINMRADGTDGKSGNVNIDANEKVNIRGKNVEVTASSVAKFFSSGLCEVVGNNTLNFYGGLVDCADGATAVIPSKGTSNFEIQQALGSFFG